MPARPTIDITRVQQLLAQGLTQAQVAQRLGVTPTGIHCAIKRAKEAVA
jgi:DNA-binding transcriptional regulator LsrR (DeoR family)